MVLLIWRPTPLTRTPFINSKAISKIANAMSPVPFTTPTISSLVKMLKNLSNLSAAKSVKLTSSMLRKLPLTVKHQN